MASEKHPSRVFLLGDSRHQHDARGSEVLAETLRAAGNEVTFSEDASLIGNLVGEAFDCVVLNTQGETFSASQVEALTQWVRGGGGLIGVHSAAATNKNDDAYARLLGSRFIGHGPVLDFEVSV